MKVNYVYTAKAVRVILFLFGENCFVCTVCSQIDYIVNSGNTRVFPQSFLSSLVNYFPDGDFAVFRSILC